MPKIVKPLTPTEVKSKKPESNTKAYADGQGLMLEVRPSGSKVWIFKYYKPYSRKRTNLTIGHYPAVSLAQARKMRLKAQALLADNIDPKEHRDKHITDTNSELNNTFKKIAANWFEVKRANISADYAQDTWRSLELHIFPRLGDVPISKLTALMVIDAINPVASKGSLETVRRLCQRINEIMTFAVNTGVIAHNPAAKISAAFKTPKPKHLPTIAPNDLSQFLKALSRASIKNTTRCLIEWQLHTMTRPGESAKAKWYEIDIQNMLWKIPAERMKKSHKDHHIPLTPQTLEILEFMRPYSGHLEYIFPADRDPKKHANTQTANAAIKRMGYEGVLVAHGLRALASTTLNEKGFEPDVIEAALSHIDPNEVRRAYNRSDYLDKRRKLMSWWSSFINEHS